MFLLRAFTKTGASWCFRDSVQSLFAHCRHTKALPPSPAQKSDLQPHGYFFRLLVSYSVFEIASDWLMNSDRGPDTPNDGKGPT